MYIEAPNGVPHRETPAHPNIHQDQIGDNVNGPK